MKVKLLLPKKMYLLLSIMFCCSTTNATTLNLTFFIDGYYDISTGMMFSVMLNQGILGATATEVVNVTIELHDAMPPYALAASNQATLMTNGTCNTSFSITGSYYIVIKYCNTLETWSASPVILYGTTINYNFSDALSKAYDDKPWDGLPCMKLMPSLPNVYSIFSGDVDQDGNIGTSDLALWKIDDLAAAYGNYCTSLNGDGAVDASDYVTYYDNLFQYAKRP